MKKKIAIVGSGFFGVSAAFLLSKKYDVSIYEKNFDILNGASRANQLRFHLGYHYPRSNRTLKEVKSMNKSFLNFFGRDVLGKTKNYYAISKTNTKTNFKNYFKFLIKNKLKFKIINNLDFSNKIEASIISEEKNLKYFQIKKKIKIKLKKSKINLYLNKPFLKKYMQDYYKVILACYDQNNIVLKHLGVKPKKKYRYELVEKIIIQIPKKYRNKSYMVLDGEFVSLDPYLGTKYHLLSDVKHSKLEIIKDYYPNFKNYKKKFLNKGIVKNIKHSHFYKFISNSSEYLPFLKKAKYVGSYFATRVIELNKEKTDERINSINIFNKKIITILSGKWNTSIALSKHLSNLLN